MEHICYNCFCDSLNEAGVCTRCGYDGAKNREKFPQALSQGAILYGRYIVGRVLGQGGFGITYLAQDYQTKELVAIKEFFPDTMATRTGGTTVTPFSGERGENFAYGRDTFLEEAKTMAEFLDNPNIVRVHSYFEENGTGYFVMEYLDGVSFQQYIKDHGGRISWEETLKIMLPVLDALSAMHAKGIIHRDVTPDNIYITKAGAVKLLDFGAARYSLGNVSRSLDVILKHGFAPKEQYKRHGRQGPYTDVYSTAATIYYVITGTKPDDAIERSDEDNLPLPTTLGARITLAQEKVLLKGLAVQPEDRYQTMDAFRDALTKRAQPESEKDTVKGTEAEKKENRQTVERKEFRGIPKWLVPVCAGAALVLVTAIWISTASGTNRGTNTSESARGSQGSAVSAEEARISQTEEVVHLHTWVEAICTTPRHCSTCGATSGEPLGHDWIPATVDAPQTCARCGATEGTALQLEAVSDIVSDAAASSTYNGDLVTHTVWNLLDGNIRTNWTEGVGGNGEGQYVEFTFRKAYWLSDIILYSGNHSSQYYYQYNSRPKSITITLSDGTEYSFTLPDTMTEQTISFDQMIQTESVRITIDSVYPGSKWTDTVISEVAFLAYEESV